MGKTSNYYFLSDDTRLFYHNATDRQTMDKLNLKCYILYETKELLTITKMYITVLNTFMFIISIAIVITTIIIIIIRITVNTISIIIVFAKSA